MKLIRRTRTSSAFTLIELLIVVAIIAILAAIAVPNFLEAQTRAKVSRAKADMRTISTAEAAYAVDWNKYQPSWVTQDPSVQRNGTTTIQGIENVGTPVNPRIQRLAWLTTPIAYITSIQNDPFSVGTQDSNPVNAEFPVFTYWDPAFVDARKVQPAADTHFEDFEEQLGVRNEYMLMSYGPDQIFHPAAFFPQLRVYDPTNGTVSAGDIYRIGGDQIE